MTAFILKDLSVVPFKSVCAINWNVLYTRLLLVVYILSRFVWELIKMFGCRNAHALTCLFKSIPRKLGRILCNEE